MQVQVEQIEGRRFMIRARGNEIIVDDTIEAGGPGDGFRPTELLLGALGACMMGTMVNFAKGQDITVDNVTMDLEDVTADKPTRLEKIYVTMELRTDAEERRQASLKRVAGACKIHNTLQTSPDIDFVFEAK